MRTRKASRKLITLPGRYFTGLGNPVDVLLKDLSTGGCRFPIGEGKLPPGSRLQIHVGSSGPHHATVKWSKDGEVGVTFARPLDHAKFEGFQSCHVHDAAQANITGEFEEMKDTRPQRFC